MKTVKFTLKQHTPIVHFQAKDNGATLRASEVKPKLDRYILEKKGRERLHDKGTLKEFREEGARYFRELDLKEIEKKKKDKEYTPKLCCIPGQNEALNYKLFFRIEENVKYFLPMNNVSEKKKKTIQGDAQDFFGLSSIELLSPSPYFANEDKVRDKRWDKVRLATQIEGDIYGEILCQNEELSKMIESYLQSFFLLHNFGARQSKGFGSYTVRSLNGKSINGDKKSIAQKMYDLYVDNCLISRVDVHYQFRQIQQFHHKLKTANRGEYSVLRRYFHEQAIEWEKPMEREMIGLPPEKGTRSYPKAYVRALLGLHGQFEFPQLNRRVKVSNQVANIERFASPITYKPIGDIIYLICEEIPDEMFNMEFVFSTDTREKRIRTPKKETFDFKDFMASIQDDNIRYIEELL